MSDPPEAAHDLVTSDPRQRSTSEGGQSQRKGRTGSTEEPKKHNVSQQVSPVERISKRGASSDQSTLIDSSTDQPAPIVDSSPTPSASNSPKGSLVPSIPNSPKGSLVPSVPNSPKASLIPSVPPNSPRGSLVPTVPDSPKDSLVPTVLDSPKGSLIPSAPNSPKGSLVPTVPDSPKGSLVPSAPNSPKGSLIPSTPNSRNASVVPKSPNPSTSAEAEGQGQRSSSVDPDYDPSEDQFKDVKDSILSHLSRLQSKSTVVEDEDDLHQLELLHRSASQFSAASGKRRVRTSVNSTKSWKQVAEEQAQAQPLPKQVTESKVQTQPLPKQVTESKVQTQPLPKQVTESKAQTQPLPKQVTESQAQTQPLPKQVTESKAQTQPWPKRVADWPVQVQHRDEQSATSNFLKETMERLNPRPGGLRQVNEMPSMSEVMRAGVTPGPQGVATGSESKLAQVPSYSSDLDVPTESKEEVKKKICKKKSREQQQVQKKDGGKSIKITISNQSLLTNPSDSRLGAGSLMGQSFLARINILEPIGNDGGQNLSAESVQSYLNANPDFLANYVANNVDMATLSAWTANKRNNMNYFDENANRGRQILQATAPYYDPCGLIPGQPVMRSGIAGADRCKKRKKTKCALSTLMNYYRQGQQVIDWSLNHGIPNYGSPAGKCVYCGQPNGPNAVASNTSQRNFQSSNKCCNCKPDVRRKPAQKSLSATNQTRGQGQGQWQGQNQSLGQGLRQGQDQGQGQGQVLKYGVQIKY